MYVKRGENIAAIQPGWKQVFASLFTLSVGQKEIIKMKNANTITDRDLEITRLLYKFRFATLEQILKYLNKLEEKDEAKTSFSVLRNRMEKLVSYKVLNKFMLTNDMSLEEIQPDAQEFYCLDLGGRYLLSHYTNEDTTDWYSVSNMKSSENVIRNITILNFYLTLLTTSGGTIEYFNVEPELRVGKSVVVPSFELSYKSGGLKSYFFGEVVKDFDFPVQFRTKAQKLNQLLETDAWKKYCFDSLNPPVLFLVTDTDELAGMVSRQIHESTEMRRFRLTTDERVLLPFTQRGSFLKYDAEKGVLTELSAKVFA